MFHKSNECKVFLSRCAKEINVEENKKERCRIISMTIEPYSYLQSLENEWLIRQ